MRKWLVLLVIICLVSGGIIWRVKGDSQSKVTLLFTHDMHDHFLSQMIWKEGEVKGYGGYGRVQTLIDQERKKDPNLLLVDAGDFSMGTLFQTIYATQAPQLRIMGQMGYDVVTLGNHEFDFRADGLAGTLVAASKSGERLPKMVAGNVWVDPGASQLVALDQAMKAYGVTPYTVVEKNGLKIGVFGLIGEDAQSNAPMAGVTFTDYVAQAKEITKKLEEEEQVDLIVCLSHTGTSSNPKKSEDEQLAKEVPAIDVIISGHTHTTLETPKQVDDVIIGSAGSYTQKIGKMVVVQDTLGNWKLEHYELLDVDESIPESSELVGTIQSYKQEVERGYLQNYGYAFDQVIGSSNVNFENEASIGKKHSELRIGNLISDAYRYAVKQAEGENYIPIAMTAVPAGTIRGSFVNGEITVSDVFTVSSLGVGEDGSAGYPLVSAYLSGKELRTICEVDASIAPIMSEAQLYLSGLHFTFNPNRMIFNKVTDCYLVNEDGEKVTIEDEKLYRVVVGLYSAQMLSVVGDKSFGLLSIIPKDQNGVAITDFTPYILQDPLTGGELKEWSALARYISSFGAEGRSEIPQRYGKAEGRKVVEEDTSIQAKLSAPNSIALGIYGLFAIIIVLFITIIVFIIKKFMRLF